MIELSLFKMDEEVMKYFLNKETTTIGRASTNDICLPDPAISRTHFVILRAEERYVATDQSTNGTFVNEQRISSHELKINDVIRVGTWTIRFGSAKSEEAEATDVGFRDPTRVLSYRPDRSELVCERGMIELQTTPKKTIAITRSMTTIGKAKSNHIVLGDDFASNYHCRIDNRKGTYFLKDLQSTNGTKLNGQKIIEAALAFNSVIEIGRTRLRFFSAEEVQTLEPAREADFEGMHSDHPRMREIFALIRRIAPSDATALIQGESGTGKELVARAIHNASGRDKRKFVAINCSAISKDLIESELFGHEKGAFTSAHQQRHGVFEQANGGTLLLDEIGEMPLDLQPKLLRTLETGEIKRVGGTTLIHVDVRIVAATNKDLSAEVRKGRFREDLFFRLFVVPIQVPPLRERPRDIPLLVESFLEQELAKQKGKQVRKIDPQAMDLLMDYTWPGNVRELKNVISRAVLDCRTETIGAGDLQFAPAGTRERTAYEYDGTQNEPQTFTKTLRDVEKDRILQELERQNWNKKATARTLGIAKSTLHEKLKRYGITDKEED
ncbi:MAG: sigma 54-interacting transcriptional regulator [Pseudomonadota bacterium]